MWAFGCVLYEMLTGVRAFSGQDVSETLAAVIRGEPDWHALTDETPAPIRRLLRRCLAKDAKNRLADASMARIEIDEALTGSRIAARHPRCAPTSRRGERSAWASASRSSRRLPLRPSSLRCVQATRRRDPRGDQHVA